MVRGDHDLLGFEAELKQQKDRSRAATAVQAGDWTELGAGEPVFTEQEIPFYNLQERVVLHNIGKIDPADITDTIAAGGYQALVKALSKMSPEQVIDEVQAAKLSPVEAIRYG